MKIFLKSAFFFVVILISCKQQAGDKLEEIARRNSHSEIVYVKTVKLEPSTFYHELISNGKIHALEKAVVPFRINGLINILNIQNGQHVKAGDLLAVIEDFEYKTALKKAIQNLEKAEINFKDDLLSNYFTIDTTRLTEAKIKISRIRSGLNDAITELERAEYNYSNTRIFTPISGVVANMEAARWNPSQNYASLCTIISEGKMFTEFPVTESEFGFLSNGMPVIISPFINDSLYVSGNIIQINPQVDEAGMIKVRAEFKNPGNLIEGMNVKVLIRKPVPDSFVVPKEALVIRQGKDVIFVRQDTLAIWKYVSVEFENSFSVSIKEGLSAGDLVIVRGNINLAHETIVREE